MILENVKERKEDKYSYHTLIDWIVDYLKEKQLIYLKACDIKKKLENICQSEIENNLCETVDETKTEKVIELLLTKLKEQVKCEFKEISKELIEDLIKTDNHIIFFIDNCSNQLCSINISTAHFQKVCMSNIKQLLNQC